MMLIAGRPIPSTQHPSATPYVIAELGVNHDGDVEKCLRLTREAAQAGAHAIKLQLFEADRLMSKAAKLAAYQQAAGERDPIEMLRRLELSIDQMAPVVELAHRLHLHAIVSVFSVELVEVAQQLPWDAYKAASPDIINKPLLRAMAETGKPLIISAGASTLQEVGRALTWLRDIKDRLAVLQCVSSYPTPFEMAELPGIAAIADIFDGVVGYSDHTDSLKTGALAVIAGAAILEKHFTYDRMAVGPDHSASLMADEFDKYRKYALLAKRYQEDPAARQYLDTFLDLEQEQRAYAMVRRVREEVNSIEKLKRVLPIEQDVRTVSRQSLTTTRALPAGHVLTREDITIKRPGTGLPPFELEHVLGKRLARGVEADMPMLPEDRAS
jgi:N,N'-diacetyllegionaminate synthase